MQSAHSVLSRSVMAALAGASFLSVHPSSPGCLVRPFSPRRSEDGEDVGTLSLVPLSPPSPCTDPVPPVSPGRCSFPAAPGRTHPLWFLPLLRNPSVPLVPVMAISVVCPVSGDHMEYRHHCLLLSSSSSLFFSSLCECLFYCCV